MNELRIYNQLMSEASEREIPPVEKWNPAVTGDIDIRIAADGTWFHEGEPINRASLVRLFSSVLWRDGDQYFLVTPVEKVRIEVEDAPLVVTQASFEGEGDSTRIFLTTLTGDRFVLDGDHPIRIDYSKGEEPRPYVRVRRNLDALIHRNVFYSLVDQAVELPIKNGVKMVLRSCGVDFVLGTFTL